MHGHDAHLVARLVEVALDLRLARSEPMEEALQRRRLDALVAERKCQELVDRIVSEDPGNYGITMERGDYGVYWDPVAEKGFAWANLDHSSDFGLGVPLCPADCFQTPDGWVGILDFLAVIGTWGSSGPCDINFDGAVDYLDFGQLFGVWGPCVTNESPSLPGFPAGPPPRGERHRQIVRSPDIDGDGRVGQSDMDTLRSSWGRCTACPADLDDDGRVGTTDLLELFANWSTDSGR